MASSINCFIQVQTIHEFVLKCSRSPDNVVSFNIVTTLMRNKMDSVPGPLSVWRLCVLPMSAWVFSGYSYFSFLPHPKMCTSGERVHLNGPHVNEYWSVCECTLRWDGVLSRAGFLLCALRCWHRLQPPELEYAGWKMNEWIQVIIKQESEKSSTITQMHSNKWCSTKALSKPARFVLVWFWTVLVGEDAPYDLCFANIYSLI